MIKRNHKFKRKYPNRRNKLHLRRQTFGATETKKSMGTSFVVASCSSKGLRQDDASDPSKCARRNFLRIAGAAPWVLTRSPILAKDSIALDLVAGSGPKTVGLVDAFGTEQLKATVREMFRVMYDRGGIGLAAPQVGIPLALFVVNQAGQPFHWAITERVFCNAVVLREFTDSGYTSAPEACLSFPEQRKKPVRRANKIEIVWQDTSGKSFQKVFSGELARILQHEIDHINGIVIKE